jgi:hypothetical protein
MNHANCESRLVPSQFEEQVKMQIRHQSERAQLATLLAVSKATSG